MKSSHNAPAYEGYEDKLAKAKRILGKKYVFHKDNRIKKGDYEASKLNKTGSREQAVKIPVEIRPIIFSQGNDIRR